MSATPLRNEKVLVIDDDEQCLKLTARMLRSAGYDVVTRSHVIGTSAAVAASRPDLVLIDLTMPTIDGDRLIPLIRRSVSRRLLVVIHSGVTESVLRERAQACGADGTISKGLPAEQFLARVSRIIGNTTAQSSRRESSS